MPKFLVLYKWTLDEQDIKVKSDDLSLDVSRAKGKISDFDRNAIEEAAVIVEKQGGSVDALSYGTAAVKLSLKDVAVARCRQGLLDCRRLGGGGRRHRHRQGSGGGDPSDRSLRLHPHRRRQLGSVQSADGAAPGGAAWPALPVLRPQTRSRRRQGSVARKLVDCTEMATVTGPAVISVLSDINKPRIPGLKQVLGAAKKPNEEIPLGVLALSAADLAAEGAAPLGQRLRDVAQERDLQGSQSGRCRRQTGRQPGQ